jgi:chromosome segregation protein
MRLLRLELFGFKSFLNRTVFQFGEGITSIVGPNGCGKSNIVDAIIWALGERGTKSLRVKDMGDVIFHGSNGKRPVNIAEVTLDLSEGGKDLAIKRRIYRDGSNEYYLNGNPVRLKDIQDFFLGTGIGLNSYAIVEQGKIEYFIQMKPLERRVIIEETSGVTRFEEKKRDATIRLEEVSTNLERIEDIYSEVIKTYEKAENEWNQWKVYKVLADKLNEIDIQILIDGYTKLARKFGKMQEKQGDIEREISNKEEERDILKKELETKEDEFSITDSIIRQLEVDIKGKEKDMENRLLEIEYVKEEHKKLGVESGGLLQQKAELEAKITRYGVEIEGLDTRKENNRILLKEEEEQGKALQDAMGALKGKIEAYEKTIEEERIKLFVSMSTLTDIKNRMSEIERVGREKQKREEKKHAEQEQMKERLHDLEASVQKLFERLEQEKQENTRIVSEETEARKKKETLAKALDEVKHTIERLRGEKQGKEGFLQQISSPEGTELEHLPDMRKLIDMIKVGEDAEQAFERFFFKEMEYYVLTQKETKAISDTVNAYDGNFIFFPRQGVFQLREKSVEVDIKWINSVEEALERIESGEEGIFINDNLYIDSRGFILKGKAAKRIDLQQFKEKKRLEKELKEIEAHLAEHVLSLRNLEITYHDYNRVWENLTEKKKEKEQVIHGIEKETIVLEAEAKPIRERLYELHSEVDVFEETSPTNVDDLLNEKEVQEKDKEQTEQRMVSIKGELDTIKRAYEDTSTKWHEVTIGIERARNLLKTLEEDTERNATNISILTEEKQNQQARIEAIGKDIGICVRKTEGLEKNYEELKSVCERLIGRYEELKKTSGNLHMEKHALQEKIDVVSRDTEKIKNRKETSEKEMVVLMEKKDTIYERLKTVYGIEDPEPIALQSNKNLETERENIVQEIAGIGEVNFRAEKEYLELKERVAFLEKQKEDLKNAMDSLKKTISKIDVISKEIFSETFETVNNTFKRFTTMLFKGGKGYLVLNQDSSGIEMYVQPPGKKVVRMEQLSGGEKALISQAFLLSLMDTKPSPFSLLDEIDAPLDDANLMSLLEIIKDISRKTQVIFITHNRITMESSHTIYGITMEDEGISKIVSVKL